MSMSALSWVSHPKGRLTASLERWVGPLATFVSSHTFGNFSGRHLSISKDGQMIELKAIPIAARHSNASSSTYSSFVNRALTHGKMP